MIEKPAELRQLEWRRVRAMESTEPVSRTVASKAAASRHAQEAPIADRFPEIDRLTASDLMLIWPEEKGWPQDIGAIAVLDGRRLLDADGRFRIDGAREHIERRAHRLPRFHQLLYWPRFGFG